MRTDELRGALEDAARSFEPSTADARIAVDRRLRRRRQRFVATIASACLVVSAGVAFAVEHRGDGSAVRIAATADQKLVPVRDVYGGQAIIATPATYSVTQLRAIETGIAGSDAVVRYARLPSALIAPGCGSGPTWIVALEPGHSIGELQRELGALATAISRGSAVHRWRSLLGYLVNPNGEPDLELFLQPAASQAEIDGARGALTSAAGVASFHFLDHNDAYTEFRRVFRDNPGLVKNISPRDLPVSFRIKLRVAADAATITRRLKRLPGASEVVGSDHRLLDEVQPLQSLFGRSAALGKLCAADAVP